MKKPYHPTLFTDTIILKSTNIANLREKQLLKGITK